MVVGGGLTTTQVLLTAIGGALAGAISMGAGEYLATKSQAEVLCREIKLEQDHIRDHRDMEVAQLRDMQDRRDQAIIDSKNDVAPVLPGLTDMRLVWDVLVHWCFRVCHRGEAYRRSRERMLVGRWLDRKPAQLGLQILLDAFPPAFSARLAASRNRSSVRRG